jgi:hypothetical protein
VTTFREIVLYRNYRLATTLGHVIVFKKNEPTRVPDILFKSVVEIGGEFVDGDAEDVFKEEQVPAQPVNPLERNEQIRKVVDAIYDKNDREDFTATGNPTLKAVSDLVGFKIDRAELAIAIKARVDENE